MVTRIRVDVTAEDIAAGHPTLPDSCPVALAVRRQFPEATVAGPYWRPSGSGGFSYKTSDRAFAWIVLFDRGEPVQPATFYFGSP